MQNIVTLGEINDALKFTTVTAAQLAEMGFAALANKPICEALPQEEARRLRTAKLYPAESIGQIRVALAKRLAAPASCLHQIQEPAPATTEIITALWEAIGHHSAQVAETGEMSPGQKLLDAARAVEMAIPPAAIATLPKSDYLEGVNIPNLREALIFLGRENGVGEGEVGDKLAQYVNSVVSGVLSKKATLHEAPQAAPAAVAVPDAVRDALLQSEAALEVATARILKADPDHSISVTSEAKALVAVRAALAATPAADAQAQTIERQRMTAGRASFFMERFLREEKLLGPNEQAALHFVIDMLEAAAPAVLPEPDAVIKEVMRLIADLECEAADVGYGHGSQRLVNEKRAAIESKMRALLAGVSAPAGQAVAFQQRVQPWMMGCFGPEISADRIERNHRFLEEALELVQSCGCTASEAHQLVDYVFGRPLGEPVQEAGGVMVTLAALCLANGLDMHECGETELARIWTKVEAIRAKQAAKPKHSPLPMLAPQAQDVGRGEVLVTVSGFTGSGKSAIAGEIEILCRALGLQVDWPGGDSEKNMTHADWTAALEQYKPRVRIVECNVPHSVVKGQDK